MNNLLDAVRTVIGPAGRLVCCRNSPLLVIIEILYLHPGFKPSTSASHVPLLYILALLELYMNCMKKLELAFETNSAVT